MKSVVFFIAAALACAEPRTTLQRLDPARLEALHQQRVEWMKVRKVDPLPSIYTDYRAVLHVHAEDAEHTKGTREAVLKAAKATGVSAVFWTDHRGPHPKTWAGLREGVLVDVVAHVALNVFTNYLNNVAQTDVDFPRIELAVAA